MKNKKAILLFEVSLVVLLVGIISIFLFRGYGIFLRAARKSRDYLELSLLAEKKIWDLHLDPGQLEQGQGVFDSSPATWQCEFGESEYDNLTQLRLQIAPGEAARIALDTIFYLRQETAETEE